MSGKLQLEYCKFYIKQNEFRNFSFGHCSLGKWVLAELYSSWKTHAKGNDSWKAIRGKKQNAKLLFSWLLGHGETWNSSLIGYISNPNVDIVKYWPRLMRFLVLKLSPSSSSIKRSLVFLKLFCQSSQSDIATISLTSDTV